MKIKKRRFVALFFWASAFLVLPAAAQNPMQYRGRFFGTEVQFKMKIDRFSTLEEIQKIKAPLMSQDYKGFYEAFQLLDVGMIQFIGTNRTNIHFQLAVEQQTEKGIRLLLIADSRAVLNIPSRTEWGLRPFFIVELTLNKKYQGEGRIHNAATIGFTENGSMDLVSYQGEPQMLSQIRAIK